jgi:hypothetical protein
MVTRPEWHEGGESVAQNKLSHAEILQRKLNARSKNEAVARQELAEKFDKLKSGIVPKEY